MISKRRLGQLVLPLAGLASGAIAGAVMTSCTVFNGVTFHANDAGADARFDGGGGGSGGSGGGPSVEHYLSPAEAAKACALLRACPEPELQTTVTWSITLQLDGTNFSQCMTWLAGRIPSDHPGIANQRVALQCLASASSCVEAEGCFNYIDLPQSDTRCAPYRADAGPDGGETSDCFDQETVLYCGNGYAQALNCKSEAFGAGATCLKNSDGPGCSPATCGGDTSSTCMGGILVFCSNTLKFETDCEYQGNTCSFDTGVGYSRCMTDGVYRDCNGVGSSCEGDKVLVCNSSNLASYNCASFGGTCKHDNGPALCSVATDACTPFAAGINTCKDGKTLNLCVAGVKTPFDCSSIGKACKADGMGLNAGCE